jgi:hypothetical protein
VLSFRAKMAVAGLQSSDVTAAIVFIEEADPDKPRLLLLEENGKSTEECEKSVFEQLSRPDVIALGMVFQQFDEREKKLTTFPYQFMGLNKRGIAVLRKAVEHLDSTVARAKNVN